MNNYIQDKLDQLFSQDSVFDEKDLVKLDREIRGKYKEFNSAKL